MFSLGGKVAVVTGSSRGIGAAIAKTFANAGATVIITSRDLAACELVASDIKRAGGAAICFECDTSDESGVKRLVEAVAKKYGTLDILVNNAGVFSQAPVDSMDTALWKRIQSVDLDGVFYCTKYAARAMKKKKYGRIINISSVAGLEGFAGSAAYCAAKFGVIGFTKAAAADLAAYNITVNAISPGLIDTRMAESFTKNKEALDSLMQPLLVKRVGTPEDIACGALYLASEEASYVTGTTLVIDGGWTSHL